MGCSVKKIRSVLHFMFIFSNEKGKKKQPTTGIFEVAQREEGLVGKNAFGSYFWTTNFIQIYFKNILSKQKPLNYFFSKFILNLYVE